MRKLILFVIATMFLTGSAFADNFKASDSPWGGRSTDADHKYGYEYAQDWLNTNGYSSINAETGYDYGDADKTFWNAGSYLFRIEGENAAYADENSIGFYTTNVVGTKKLTEIFEGEDSAGDTEFAKINKSFGLYINTPEENTFYSSRFFNDNGGIKNVPQALIYTLEADKKWLVCFEDLKWKCGDKDFNDAMVTVTATPEPISAGLFLLGGGALALIRRGRKSA